MNQAIIFLLTAISLGGSATGEARGPAMSKSVGPVHKVNINVVAQEQLKKDITLNVGQALETLANVRFAKENPDWTIEIVTLTLQDQEGNPTAVALSVVVLEHGQQMKMLRTLAKAWRYVINAGLLERDQPLEVGMRELLTAIEELPEEEPLTVVSQHRMCLIPVQKLGAACHDTAVDFATRFLGGGSVTQETAQTPSATQVSVASATPQNN